MRTISCVIWKNFLNLTPEILTNKEFYAILHGRLASVGRIGLHP